MWLSIKQVAFTYLTRRLVLLYCGIVALMQIPTLLSFIQISNSDRVPGLFNSIGFLIAFVSFVLVDQGKRQFAHPRARILPGFRKPHLLVIVFLIVTIIIAWPLFLAISLEYPPVGILSFSLSLSASLIWATHFGTILVILLPIAVFYSTMSTAGLNFWTTGTGQIGFVHGLFITSSLIAIGAWLTRLANLEEENDEYGDFPFKNALYSKNRVEHAEIRNAIARQISKNRLQGWLSDRWHDRLTRFSSRPHSIVSLLSYGSSTIPTGVTALFSSSFMLAIFLLMLNFSYMADVTMFNSFSSLMMPIFMMAFFPTISISMAMMGRRTRMSKELLFPLERSRLIDSIIKLNRINVAKLWVAMHISLLILCIAAIPVWSREMQSTAVHFLLMSLALVLPSTSAMMYLAGRISSMITLMFCVMGVLYIEIGIICLWWFESKYLDDSAITAIFVVLLTILGFWLSRVNRSLWMRLELG